MSKYLVTGLGGSGKSTVCESLRSRGVNVFDSNNVPGLASWRDAYTDKPIKVDPSSYVDWSKVAWNWDESALKKLLADNENLILCGSASHQMRFHRLFDRIFVLTLDRKTHRRHLEGRLSPYGKDSETMAELLDEQQEFAKNLISLGAIAIDASGTPEQAAEQILEHINES